MILSILIPTLYKRAALCDELVRHLNRQIGKKKVEVITYPDNGECVVGKKRNELLRLAKGKYVVSLDDDDSVPDYYVSEILKGCKTNCDSMAINGTMTTNGKNEKKWFIAIENNYNEVNGIYYRFPNHITPIKREHALKAMFPEIKHGEDYQFALRLKELGVLKTQHVIEKPMYHYRYITNK